MSYDPAIPLLGIYPRAKKTCQCKNIYPIICGSFIRNNPHWEQPDCHSSVDGYTGVRQFNAAVNSRNCKILMPSKVSEAKDCLLCVWFQNSQKDKCTVMPVKLGVALGEGKLGKRHKKWRDYKGTCENISLIMIMFMVHYDDGLQVLFICQYCSHLFCVVYIVLTIFFSKAGKN